MFDYKMVFDFLMKSNYFIFFTFRYEPGRRDQDNECRYNENKGYVVFSAMGSFFIPMTVMVYVYLRISCVVARRHDQMAEIEVHKVCSNHYRIK